MSEYDNELSKIVAELNRAAPSQKFAAFRGSAQSTASLDQLLHAAAGRGASDVLLHAGAAAIWRPGRRPARSLGRFEAARNPPRRWISCCTRRPDAAPRTCC